MGFLRKPKGGDPASLYDRGLAAYKRGDYSSAIRDFGRLIDLDPGSPPAYYQRGLAYARSGQLAKALADFEMTVHLGQTVSVGSPAQAREQLIRAEYNCALACEKLGRYEQALEHYDRTIELQPVHSEAWCNRGNVLLQLGEYGLAAESCSRAIELDPGDYLAYFSRAIANQQTSSGRQVVEDLREYVRLAPPDHPQMEVARRALEAEDRSPD